MRLANLEATAGPAPGRRCLGSRGYEGLTRKGNEEVNDRLLSLALSIRLIDMHTGTYIRTSASAQAHTDARAGTIRRMAAPPPAHLHTLARQRCTRTRQRADAHAHAHKSKPSTSTAHRAQWQARRHPEDPVHSEGVRRKECCGGMQASRDLCKKVRSHSPVNTYAHTNVPILLLAYARASPASTR